MDFTSSRDLQTDELAYPDFNLYQSSSFVMSTIKNHLTSDVNHTIPTYKKLPPIQSPTPGKGSSLIKPITVARSTNTSTTPQAHKLDGAVIQGKRILSPKQKEAEAASKSAGTGSLKSQKGTLISRGDAKHVYKSTDLVGVKSGGDSKNVELIGYRSVEGKATSPAAKTTSTTTPASTAWSPPGSELPPCKICGDKASGLHYGVYTCEACKAFFRRTLKRANLDFTCTCTEEERAKGVDQPRKTTCPKCRYDRCVKVGMSKDAIKIGRYTINRKRQNDREVTRLREQGGSGKRDSTGSTVDNSPASGSSDSPYGSGQSVSSPEELSSNITTMSLEETKESVAKRKRGNDYKGDGALFRSLTNSIVMSLMENKKTAANQNTLPDSGTDLEVSHMEKLYMQPFQPPVEVAKQPEAPPGVKFTPPQDQLMMLQQGGNSNPFSVPPKGGNAPKVPVQNIQGLSPLSVDSGFQASPGGGIENLLASSNQITASPGPANQNAPIGNNSITLQIVNQGGKLVAQGAIDKNETSPIEMLLQAPAELSPMTSNQSFTNSPLSSQETASEPSPQSDPLMSGGGYDHDAVVPSMMNETLPSPLTEETGYDLDSMNIPVDEHHLNRILNAKTDEDLLKGLAHDIDITEALPDGLPTEGDDGYFDIDYQLEQFDIYQEPVISPGKGISIDEINSTISQLVGMAEALELGVRKMSCMEIMTRHKTYLEQYQMKTKVFGKMDISQEEYITFYNQTGIDIDNRQQILIEALKYMEISIAKLAKFTKVIPGFPDLDIDDQVALIKSSQCCQDMVKVGGGGQICPKAMETMEIRTMPWNKDYHVEELEKVFPKSFLQWKNEYCRKIWNLDLTVEEASITRAIIVTFPDQCTLKNRDAVEAIHNRLIACLCHLLAVRCCEKRRLTFNQLMETIVELVVAGHTGNQAIKEVFEVWPVSNNHTLLKEVLS